jgi:CHAD domain-containing protein
MEKEQPQVLTASQYSIVKQRLTGKLNDDLSQFVDSGEGFKGVARDLDQSKERVARYCHLRNDFKSIRKGLMRVYSNGRGHFYRIKEHFNMEEFHEYRKITKYLYYQMDLLQPVYPKLMKAYASTIDKHSELLGEVRDLDRLECYIKKLGRDDLSAAGKRKFMAVIMEERKSLMDKILSRAGLIYAERTKEFVNRINSYWKYHFEQI